MRWGIFLLLCCVTLNCIEVSVALRNRNSLRFVVDHYAETGDPHALSQIFTTFNQATNFQSPYIYQNLMKALRTYMECLKQNVQLGTQPFLEDMIRQSDVFLEYFLTQYYYIFDEIIYTLDQLLDHSIVDGLLYRLAGRLNRVASEYNLATSLYYRGVRNNVYRDINDYQRLRNIIQQNRKYLHWIDSDNRNRNSAYQSGINGNSYGNQGQLVNQLQGLQNLGTGMTSMIGDGLHTISSGLKQTLAHYNDYLSNGNPSRNTNIRTNAQYVQAQQLQQLEQLQQLQQLQQIQPAQQVQQLQSLQQPGNGKYFGAGNLSKRVSFAANQFDEPEFDGGIMSGGRNSGALY